MEIKVSGSDRFFTCVAKFFGDKAYKIFTASPVDDAKLHITNENNYPIFVGPSEDLSIDSGFKINPNTTLDIELPAQTDLYVMGGYSVKEYIVRVAATLW